MRIFTFIMMVLHLAASLYANLVAKDMDWATRSLIWAVAFLVILRTEKGPNRD